jgi:hypothetical protein
MALSHEVDALKIWRLGWQYPSLVDQIEIRVAMDKIEMQNLAEELKLALMYYLVSEFWGTSRRWFNACSHFVHPNGSSPTLALLL